MEQDKDDKDGKQKDKKASFRKRICAYFIDILIVSFLLLVYENRMWKL